MTTEVVESKAQIDLLKFCGADDPRRWLRKPFRHNGYLYATNGQLAVRVADDQAVEAMEGRDASSTAESLEKYFSANPTNGVELPQLRPLAECNPCEGTGKAHGCAECDGDGEFDHGSYTYECKACDGSGQDRCSTGALIACCHCSGTGKDNSDELWVGGAVFNLRYLHLIATLPGLRIAVEPSPTVSLFTFDGGVGALMPIRPDCARSKPEQTGGAQ